MSKEFYHLELGSFYFKGLEACEDFVNNKEMKAGGFHDEDYGHRGCRHGW